MNKQIFTVMSLSVLLAGCGGGSDNSTAATTTAATTTAATTTAATTTAAATVSANDPAALKCSADATSTAAYTDTFISGAIADREWGAETAANSTTRLQVKKLTVAEIADQFNAARALDPTIKERLVMPSQATWDNLSPNNKGLFLVNSERCARGILPYQGSISNMTTSAAAYARDELSAKQLKTLPHTSGGSIDSKMVTVGVYQNLTSLPTGKTINADFLSQRESLAFVEAATSPRPTLYEVEARSVYSWLYADKGESYGHRTHVLQNALVDNTGTSNSEGLFGLATEINNDNTFSGLPSSQGWTVMHTFDPNSNFDMSTAVAAPALYGPASQADCGSGTYTANADLTLTASCK